MQNMSAPSPLAPLSNAALDQCRHAGSLPREGGRRSLVVDIIVPRGASDGPSRRVLPAVGAQVRSGESERD